MRAAVGSCPHRGEKPSLRHTWGTPSTSLAGMPKARQAAQNSTCCPWLVEAPTWSIPWGVPHRAA